MLHGNVRPGVSAALAAASMVAAILLAQSFYDVTEAWQRRDRNYAELAFVLMLPAALGALAGGATRGLMGFASASLAAALAIAAYVADRYASPLTYDNSADYVASVYVSTGVFFAAAGLLVPFAVVTGVLAWGLLQPTRGPGPRPH